MYPHGGRGADVLDELAAGIQVRLAVALQDRVRGLQAALERNVRQERDALAGELLEVRGRRLSEREEERRGVPRAGWSRGG